MTLGVLLDPAHAFTVLHRGPAADANEVCVCARVRACVLVCVCVLSMSLIPRSDFSVYTVQ